MNKKYFYIAIVVTLLGGSIVAALWILPKQRQAPALSDYKNITYHIDGQQVKLKNGVAETEIVPDAASKIITRYFGNELKTDLNGDGRDDVVFLLTQNTGGSGTFFYVVAALSTVHGYVGSDGYLLGDRIAPQTTERSQKPGQKNVVIVNYADRAPGEPMTTQPSIGKSVYLQLNSTTMQWDPHVALDPTPQSITLSGTYVCLPHIDANGPQTEECAFGLKTDTGDYYAVNFGQSADAMRQFQHGAHITADGFVVIKEALNTDQWAKYNMKGIFTITAPNVR
jgi:hypothetical protein